jgi:hypothetical protein
MGPTNSMSYRSAYCFTFHFRFVRSSTCAFDYFVDASSFCTSRCCSTDSILAVIARAVCRDSRSDSASAARINPGWPLISFCTPRILHSESGRAVGMLASVSSACAKRARNIRKLCILAGKAASDFVLLSVKNGCRSTIRYNKTVQMRLGSEKQLRECDDKTTSYGRALYLRRAL